MRTTARSGFTLVEIMVVLILMVILLGFGAVLFMNMFRRTELDQAGIVLRSQLNNARIQAVKTRRPYFLVFRKRDEDVDGTGPSLLTRPVIYTWIYEDTQNTGMPPGAGFMNLWNDAGRHYGSTPSRRIDGTAMQLPMGLEMHSAATANMGGTGMVNWWIAFHPTGRVAYPPSGYANVWNSQFDAAINANPPTASGDLILRNADGHKVCVDIDEGMGRVRRIAFIQAGN